VSQIIFSKLVGVSFEGRQANIEHFVKPDQELFWVHESENKYDSNAIHVFADLHMRCSIGHLNKELAKHFVERIAKGETQRIFCAQITGVENRSKGVNIKIVVQ
jgi:hypothetical protein